MNYLLTFWNSPIGPKTTHFWGPVSNFGWSMQGWADRNRPADTISKEFQFSLVVYSTLFARFAWRVQPRNYLLLAMHVSNLILQGRLFFIRYQWENDNPELYQQQLKEQAEKNAAQSQ